MKLADQARGKWAAILPVLGVKKEFLTNRHGPCPMCAGTDRFRFDDKGRGMWFCNQCGSGDGIELVKRVNNWEFKEAAREIEKHVGTAPIIEIRNGPDPAVIKAEINSIWKAAVPLAEVPATAEWWRRRVGSIPECRDLRAAIQLACPNHGFHPAMVAMVRGPDGKAVNLHRTFLDRLGGKAEVPEPRRVMPLPMPKGCAVRLGEAAPTLGIAEGIETAVAATLMFGVPCWAALNAGNMEGWAPPEGVERVMIFGDNDDSFTGNASSYILARNLRRRPQPPEVLVHIPEDARSDWNDVLGRRDPNLAEHVS